MSRQTLEELTKCDKPKIPHRDPDKRRAAFIPMVALDCRIPAKVNNEESKKIVSDSEYGPLTREEREQRLALRRAEKIRQIADELGKKYQKPKRLEMPELSPEMQEKLEERKERLKAKEPGQPTFKPVVMDYSDFMTKIREQMRITVKIGGFEADVKRRRLAYQRHLQQKGDESRSWSSGRSREENKEEPREN
jgi:hypothetical protein